MAVSITDVAYLNDFYIMAEKMGGGNKIICKFKSSFFWKAVCLTSSNQQERWMWQKKNDVTQEYLIILILKFKQFNIQYVMYVDNSVINIWAIFE